MIRNQRRKIIDPYLQIQNIRNTQTQSQIKEFLKIPWRVIFVTVSCQYVRLYLIEGRQGHGHKLKYLITRQGIFKNPYI